MEGGVSTAAPLVARAALAFVVFPGVVAYGVPLLLMEDPPPAGALTWLGAGCVVVGTGVLLACVYEFFRRGRGTLAPWDPPRRLVETGPYRRSRNPMYVAVVIVLVGWSVACRSPSIAGWTVIMAVVFHLRVVLFEEPKLRDEFGEAWQEYAGRVPRWIGAGAAATGEGDPAR